MLSGFAQLISVCRVGTLAQAGYENAQDFFLRTNPATMALSARDRHMADGQTRDRFVKQNLTQYRRNIRRVDDILASYLPAHPLDRVEGHIALHDIHDPIRHAPARVDQKAAR